MNEVVLFFNVVLVLLFLDHLIYTWKDWLNPAQVGERRHVNRMDSLRALLIAVTIEIGVSAIFLRNVLAFVFAERASIVVAAMLWGMLLVLGLYLFITRRMRRL